jgi:hypothetical protein
LTIYRRAKPLGQHRVVWKDDAFQEGNASHGAKRIAEPAAENAAVYRPKFGPHLDPKFSRPIMADAKSLKNGGRDRD